MKLFNHATVGIVALALLLTGCGAASEGPSGDSPSAEQVLPEGISLNEAGGQAFQRNDAVEGGTLRVGMNAPTETLDPTAAVGTGPLPIMRAVFDALFVYDVNGDVTPELAESIETTDKGKTWTLKLPQGINFTDGTPFNSEAVVQHLTSLAAEGSRSRSAGDARTIESMTTPDAVTVEFTLKEASMLFPKMMTAGIYGSGSMIPSPTAVAKYGKDFGSNIVGVGPFMLESFKSGGEITIKKNPDYRIKGLPHLDGLTYVPATDTQSRLSAAIAGDIDLASTQSATDLRQATENNLISAEQVSTSYYNLLFNLSKPPFDNVKFRRAVTEAIDLEGLNEAVFDGLQTPMRGIFPESNLFSIETDWPRFNPEGAKKLVEEYVQETGNKAEFTLTTTSPPEFQKQAQVMQQMLADAGITMTLNVGDQPTMITEALSGNYHAQHRYTAVSVEVSQTLRNDFHSLSAANNSQGGNPKVDALLDSLRDAATTEERKVIYEDLQKELKEWLPIVPLIAHENGWYLGKKVGGFPGADPATTEPDVRQLWRLK